MAGEGILPVSVVPAINLLKFYAFSLSDVPGVVAANNFLSVFNPVGSGRNLVFYQSIVNAYAGGATTSTTSLNIFRTTAASAGTLITASAVPRFVTSDGPSVAEVRIGNPTVTTINTTLQGISPAITTAGAGTSASGGGSTPSGSSFVCVPGEGLVMRTAAGDVDQLWNLTFVWSEQ